MNQWPLPALMVILALMTGCNGGDNDSQANNNDTTSEKSTHEDENSTNPNSPDVNKNSGNKQNISEKDGYELAANKRFNFQIAVPENWKVLEKSANKDGFFIKTGNDKTDIRVYGEERAGMEDISSFECKEESTFEFADGKAGTHCIIEGGALYYREKDGQRVTFYIEAPKSWRASHADKLEHMAKSLTFRKDKPFT